MTLTPPAIEPRMRRLRSADGLDPAGPRPGLAWLSRETHRLGEGQFRMSVPCVLASSVSDGVHVDLTHELRRAWVDRPRRIGHGRVTGIVAAFAASTGRSAELTLAFTTTGALPDVIGDADMHADLTRILDEVLQAAPPPHTSSWRPQ